MLKRAAGKTRDLGAIVSAPEACEVLRFCFGDLWDPDAHAAAQQARGNSHQVRSAELQSTTARPLHLTAPTLISLVAYS